MTELSPEDLELLRIRLKFLWDINIKKAIPADNGAAAFLTLDASLLDLHSKNDTNFWSLLLGGSGK